jgi:hypothetical protein
MKHTKVAKPRAVVFSYSRINSDPRLLRQLSWLEEKGFDVAVVGYGLENLSVFAAFLVPVQGFVPRTFNYLKSNRGRYEGLYGKYLPESLAYEVARADLVVINELEFVPFMNSTEYSGPIYLDLHENHVDGLSGSWLEVIFFSSYWKWQLKQAESFVSRFKTQIFLTTVESVIAEKYKTFFDLNTVALILNAPKVIDLPSRQPSRMFKLVHHGMSKSNRGIETIVRSMASLREVATLTLMLVKEPTIPFVSTKVRLITWAKGLSKVVSNSDPVPVQEVSKALSNHDIAIVLGSDKTGNDLYALPNKFFQSVQAGLMIICGPNPAVSKLVQEHQLGIVLPDWSSESLIRAVQELTPEVVAKYRSNVLLARHVLSEEKSREVFMNGISLLMTARSVDGGSP